MTLNNKFLFPTIAIGVLVLAGIGFVWVQWNRQETREPDLVWYRPGNLDTNVVARARRLADFKGIDANYWCAIDEFGLDGGFFVRQRSLKTNPGDALLEGHLDFVESQSENEEIEINERVNIGPYSGFYVKSSRSGTQWAQRVMWETDETYVMLAADSWCKSDDGDELTKNELLAIAESTLRNPVPIYEPAYLPRKVNRISLEWYESESPESIDIESGTATVLSSSRKKEIGWNYICGSTPGTGTGFSISHELHEDGADIDEVIGELKDEDQFRENSIFNNVDVGGSRAIYIESEGFLSTQRLSWITNEVLITITSVKDSCETAKEDLLKTAESFIPIPKEYFLEK